MPDEWSISLFLGTDLGQSHTTTANIYLQFRLGDEEMSNMWAGDIHIASMMNGTIDVPRIGAKVDWQRMSDAVSHCTEHHNECRVRDRANLPPRFRLIDMERRSIVENSNASFAALRYVWGTDTRASLLTATGQRLKTSELKVAYQRYICLRPSKTQCRSVSSSVSDTCEQTDSASYKTIQKTRRIKSWQ